MAGTPGFGRVRSGLICVHVLAPSHPCMTAGAALRLKGLEYERVEFVPGAHVEQMQAIYGESNHTVPGMLVDGEPVHGSRAILERLPDRQLLHPAGSDTQK